MDAEMSALLFKKPRNDKFVTAIRQMAEMLKLKAVRHAITYRI
jgi:hypothetical protein